MDEGTVYDNESGTPQGSPLSPLLTNIALDGMERDTKAHLNRLLHQHEKEKSNARGKRPSSHKCALSVVRYADDFVIMHESKAVIIKAKEFLSEWLKQRGLELKPEKTRLCHSLHEQEGIAPGFNFLGFHIRQFLCNDRQKGYKLIIRPAKEATKRHSDKLKAIVRKHRALDQKGLIWLLNPIIRGWCNYYQYVVSKLKFSRLGNLTFRKIWGWACFRHNRRSKKWIKSKYFVKDGGNNWRFCTSNGQLKLAAHTEWKITRFVKVKGGKSPYDGDFIYWASRMGRYAGSFPKTADILKRQQGKCWKCRLFFKTDDTIILNHANSDVNDLRWNNLTLIHGHCKIQGEVFMTRTKLLRSRMP